MRVEGLASSKGSHFSVILEVSFSSLTVFTFTGIHFYNSFSLSLFFLFLFLKTFLFLHEDIWSRSNIFYGRHSESSWRCQWVPQGQFSNVDLSLSLSLSLCARYCSKSFKNRKGQIPYPFMISLSLYLCARFSKSFKITLTRLNICLLLPRTSNT